MHLKEVFIDDYKKTNNKYFKNCLLRFYLMSIAN